jgi:hypothetical protein
MQQAKLCNAIIPGFSKKLIQGTSLPRILASSASSPALMAASLALWYAVSFFDFNFFCSAVILVDLALAFADALARAFGAPLAFAFAFAIPLVFAFAFADPLGLAFAFARPLALGFALAFPFAFAWDCGLRPGLVGAGSPAAARSQWSHSAGASSA